ncbi:MAG: hypothetical protein ABIH34_00045 [Nanoarchaeota archaeon]
MAEEIAITYETLFELLRREKSREELQKLSERFYDDVQQYIQEKNQVMNQQRSDLFSDEEIEKTQKQLANIQKILREFYDRREKKIFFMALNKSRTGSHVIDTSVLLPNEQQLYHDLVATLNMGRKQALQSLFSARTEAGTSSAPKHHPDPLPAPASLPSVGLKSEATSDGPVTVRFLKPVPSFVGEDLTSHGPFEAEEIASLPSEVANVLVDRGRAEEIKGD